MHLFRRLGVDSMTVPRATELIETIFGSKSLRTHFSLERWGGCDPAVLDNIDRAGAAGLRRFGYATWRELAERADRGPDKHKPRGCSVGEKQLLTPSRVQGVQGPGNGDVALGGGE